MSEPNVLLLDEPTNDLDIETLTALEDLLDHWPGTLVVVSHDRYFIERVADNVFALDAIGGIRHLPGGIDQYLRRSRRPPPRPLSSLAPRRRPAPNAAQAGAQIRQARKDVQRLERELERSADRERELHAEMTASATEHTRLGDLTAQLDALVAERERLESEWLEAAALVDPH